MALTRQRYERQQLEASHVHGGEFAATVELWADSFRNPTRWFVYNPSVRSAGVMEAPTRGEVIGLAQARWDERAWVGEGLPNGCPRCLIAIEELLLARATVAWWIRRHRTRIRRLEARVAEWDAAAAVVSPAVTPRVPQPA